MYKIAIGLFSLSYGPPALPPLLNPPSPSQKGLAGSSRNPRQRRSFENSCFTSLPRSLPLPSCRGASFHALMDDLVRSVLVSHGFSSRAPWGLAYVRGFAVCDGSLNFLLLFSSFSIFYVLFSFVLISFPSSSFFLFPIVCLRVPPFVQCHHPY